MGKVEKMRILKSSYLWGFSKKITMQRRVKDTPLRNRDFEISDTDRLV